MREFYMDTNVFISVLKNNDPYHSEAKSIVYRLQKDEIRAETSVITVLEIASVTSRSFEDRFGGKRPQEQRGMFVAKALRRFSSLRTKFIHLAGDVPFAMSGIETDMPSIFNEAIYHSLKVPLRTLDLIHLAAAKYAGRLNKDLGAFVTGDKGFLAMKENLSKTIEMPLLSPKEYVDALRL
jgi:predicted nucleic acid-binding protein